MRRLTIVLLFLTAACINKKADKDGRINLLEKSAIKKDSTQQRYYSDQLYVPNIVRLDKVAFIYIDSLRFAAGTIDKANREAYYRKALATIPKDELAVHKAIWALDEVRSLQQANGGYGTIVTWITSKPGNEQNHYTIELRKNNIEEMTPLKDISSFTVKLSPLHIEIANSSGYYVPLSEWRAARK